MELRELTADEKRQRFQQQAKRYKPPVTAYGFVGRDLDVLTIETKLLSQNNLLLIQGMGGTGKTTLLHHLGEWWQLTHFIEAAESSLTEAAWKTHRTTPPEQSKLRITDEIWQYPKVFFLGNCGVYHLNAENGTFEDAAMRLLKCIS